MYNSALQMVSEQEILRSMLSLAKKIKEELSTIKSEWGSVSEEIQTVKKMIKEEEGEEKRKNVQQQKVGLSKKTSDPSVSIKKTTTAERQKTVPSKALSTQSKKRKMVDKMDNSGKRKPGGNEVKPDFGRVSRYQGGNLGRLIFRVKINYFRALSRSVNAEQKAGDFVKKKGKETKKEKTEVEKKEHKRVFLKKRMQYYVGRGTRMRGSAWAGDVVRELAPLSPLPPPPLLDLLCSSLTWVFFITNCKDEQRRLKGEESQRQSDESWEIHQFSPFTFLPPVSLLSDACHGIEMQKVDQRSRFWTIQTTIKIDPRLIIHGPIQVKELTKESQLKPTKKAKNGLKQRLPLYPLFIFSLCIPRRSAFRVSFQSIRVFTETEVSLEASDGAGEGKFFLGGKVYSPFGMLFHGEAMNAGLKKMVGKAKTVKETSAGDGTEKHGVKDRKDSANHMKEIDLILVLEKPVNIEVGGIRGIDLEIMSFEKCDILFFLHTLGKIVMKDHGQENIEHFFVLLDNHFNFHFLFLLYLAGLRSATDVVRQSKYTEQNMCIFIVNSYMGCRKKGTVLEHYQQLIAKFPFDSNTTTYRIIGKELVDNKLKKTLEIKNKMRAEGFEAGPMGYSNMLSGQVKHKSPDQLFNLYEELKGRGGGCRHDEVVDKHWAERSYGEAIKVFSIVGMKCGQFGTLSYNNLVEQLKDNGILVKGKKLYKVMGAKGMKKGNNLVEQLRDKFQISLDLPMAATMNCAENTDAKHNYIILVFCEFVLIFIPP